MTEEWRPVDGFEGYEVSNLGNVRSWRTKGNHFGTLRKEPRLLKLIDNGVGYRVVQLAVMGNVEKKYVHRLVADAFLSGPASQEIAHWNGIRSDNRAENLRWASVKENQANRKRHGTHGSRFTENEVRAIREAYELGFVTERQLAHHFGVSPTHVGRIVRGETWSHLV